MIFKSIVDKIIEKSKSRNIVDVYVSAEDWYNRNENIHAGYVCMVCIHIILENVSLRFFDKRHLKKNYNILRKELPTPSEAYQNAIASYVVDQITME